VGDCGGVGLRCGVSASRKASVRMVRNSGPYEDRRKPELGGCAADGPQWRTLRTRIAALLAWGN
jgi:hypothetical protein